MLRPALLLDRDGTLIHDVGYPRDPSLVTVLEGAAIVLARARKAGFALVIVSNQSGVARGLLTEEDVARVQARTEQLFDREGVTFDRAYFCLHGPNDGCDCRKPEPGMLLRAGRELGLALDSSVMIGDKDSDVLAGRRAGCESVLFGRPGAPFQTWHEFGTWLEARVGNCK